MQLIVRATRIKVTVVVASKAQSYYSAKQAKESGGMLPQESISTATF